jgi:hypothetical protein
MSDPIDNKAEEEEDLWVNVAKTVVLFEKALEQGPEGYKAVIAELSDIIKDMQAELKQLKADLKEMLKSGSEAPTA